MLHSSKIGDLRNVPLNCPCCHPSTPPPPLVQTPSAESPASDKAEGMVVDPQDVMQKDLADFFLQAAAATKVSRLTPFYHLHKILGSRISNINLLYVSILSGFAVLASNTPHFIAATLLMKC